MSYRSHLSRAAQAAAVLFLCLSVVSCSKTARRQRVANRAETYFRASQLDQAKVEYSNLLRLDPANPLPYQRLGSIWFQEGAPLRAAPFLLKAKELAPNDTETRLKLGRVYLSISHRTEAFAEAMNVLQAQPANGEAIQVASEAAQTEEERNQITQTIGKITNPNDVAVLLAEATLFAGKGDQAAAKEAIEKAISADPNSASAHVFMGTLWSAARQAEKAGNEFKLAASLAPPRSAERLRYAQFQVQSGAIDDALTTLRSITSVAPDFLPAWLLQAEISLTKKNYGEATRLLANVLNRDPDNIDGNVLQARSWMASGETDKAVQTLQRLDSQYPDFAPLKLELARAYLQKNNLPQATTALEQALAASPDFVDAALLLGQLNLRAGKPKAVIEPMKSLIEKHGNVAAAKLLLADAYRALGQLDDAANIFRERLNILPNDVEACIALGIILRQQKKDDEARETLERAQRLAPANILPLSQLIDLDLSARNFEGAERRLSDPSSGTVDPAMLAYLQGKVYAAQNKWDLAESSLNKALQFNPNLGVASELLATVYISTNKTADAARQLEAVVKQVPNEVRTLMILGGLYEKLHEFGKARDVYEKVTTISPEFAPALNNLAFIYTEHFDQLDRAYQLAEKARGIQPGDGSIADTLAWVYYKKRDYQQAINLLGEAVRKSPNDPEVRYHLGMCQYMMGDADGARATLEQVVKSPTDFPNKADAQRRLALLSKSQPSGAVTAQELQAIVNQQPDDVFARTRLAERSENDGSFRQAAAQYEEVLKLNPKAAPVMAKLAEIYSGPLNDPGKAIEFAKSARDLSPGDPTFDVLLGRIAYKTGNYSWAYSLLKQAASNLPNNPEAMYAFGWAAFSIGKISEARDCMERVLKIVPGTPLAVDAQTWLTFAKFDSDVHPTNGDQEQITAILKKDPGYVPALLAQAAVAEQGGDANRAINLYQQVLNRFPDFAPAQKHLAALYAQPPADLSKAYDFAMKARKALPDDVELTRTLALISYQRKDYTRAMELLQDVARKEPLHPSDLYYLGMCFFQTKDVDQARATLNQALAGGLRDPLAGEATKTLQQIR